MDQLSVAMDDHQIHLETTQQKNTQKYLIIKFIPSNPNICSRISYIKSISLS
jgi:hypothetical protein